MRYESEEEDTFQDLLEYFNNLLKRENLCHNTYLYKQMRTPLTFPLYVITDEKTVGSITRDYSLIIDALKRTGLVELLNGKEVRLIEHPTVKINVGCFVALRQIQRILQEKGKKYEITRRFDTEEYVNLTVLSENSAWLQELILSVDPKIKYQPANLMDDIRFGVDRIRKLKVEHAKQKTEVGRVKYSLQRPPQVFIRKALESSSGSEQEDLQNKEGNGNGKYKNGKNGHGNSNGYTNGKPKKHTNGNKHKPNIKEQDFPHIE